MVLASTFTDVILWALWVFFLFLWLMILFYILSDLFRDHEMDGIAKAIWIIALIFFTPITALVYLIVRGRGMTERSIKAQKEAQAQFADYVQSVGGGSSTPAAQIAHAKELLDSGAITQAEFDQLKAKALA